MAPEVGGEFDWAEKKLGMVEWICDTCLQIRVLAYYSPRDVRLLMARAKLYLEITL